MEKGRGGQFKLGQEHKQKNVTSGAKLATSHALLILQSLRKKSECRRVSYQKLRLTTLILVGPVLTFSLAIPEYGLWLRNRKIRILQGECPHFPATVLNTALLQQFPLAEHLRRSVHAQGKATSTHQCKMTR